MPRIMPPLAAKLTAQIDGALALANAGEVLRAGARPGSVVWRELRSGRLEALYEMAYLRLFISWETFLEESLQRYLCGYVAGHGAIPLRQAASRTMGAAETAVLAGQQFVSWADPVRVEQRARQFMFGGAYAQVLAAARARIQAFASVRHRVAHASDYARQRFDQATMMLAARPYPGP